MKRNWIAAVVLSAALVIAVVLAACSPKTAGSGAGRGQETSSEEGADTQDQNASADGTANGSSEAGPSISFEAVDLKGNPVRSEDIFSKNRLTMVNIWGTFCGPCIDEMPELEKLNYRLKQKNCVVVGVVCDVQGPEDSTTIGAAEDIIEEIGVKYLNLLPWNELDDQFPAQFIPTTYFVDSEGHILGEPAVGARSADSYEDLIDDILKKME